MWKLIDKFMDRASAVIGAFVFMQAPEFFQQYTHRLAGHVAELKNQVTLLENIANLSGKTIDQYVAKLQANSDLDISQQAIFLKNMLTRWHSLETSLSAIQQSSWFSKPYLFLYHLQTDIAWATFVDFSPGISFTIESIPYAILGIIIGYGLYHLLKYFFRKLGSLFFSNKQTSDGITMGSRWGQA